MSVFDPDNRPLAEDLASFLAELGPQSEEHPDESTLAAHLDDVVDADEKARVEAHLAECDDCRSSWLESARALWSSPDGGQRRQREAVGSEEISDHDDGARSRRPRDSRETSAERFLSRGRPRLQAIFPIAAAVTLAIGFTAWLLRPVDTGELVAAGVGAEEIRALDRSAARAANRALLGELTDPLLFRRLDPEAPHLGSGPQGIVRDLPVDAAQPVAPRWSLVSTPRPDFVARLASGDLPVPNSVPFVLLILDDKEELLLEAEGDVVPDHQGVVRVPYPRDAPDLPRDALFAWSLELRLDPWREASPLDPRTRTTPWVPAAYSKLAATWADSESPEQGLLLASLLASRGFFEEALSELQASAESYQGSVLRLARSILEHKRLTPTQVESELDRLFSKGRSP